MLAATNLNCALFIRILVSHKNSIRCLSDKLNLLNIYERKVINKELNKDSYQEEVAKQLQNICNEIADYSPPKIPSLFQSMFKKNTPIKTPKGLYLWGSVGCGKTMLMDLFYENCEIPNQHKRRVHFHSFMLDVHSRIHQHKKQTASSTSKKSLDYNPFPSVAQDLVEEGWLLCLDEFQVTDIGDAMILKLLFDQLFAKGIIMISTSNRPPDDLYKNGLQRSNFLPFIPLLKKHCKIISLDSGIDYRQKFLSKQSIYFISNEESEVQLDKIFKILASKENDHVRSKTLTIKGRNVKFYKTCGQVTDCTFEELCDRPLGAIDYLMMSQVFHTVIIRNIPQLTYEKKTQARRFITLIDTFYDNKVRVLFSAQVLPKDLFLMKKNSETISDDDRKLMDDLGIKHGTEQAKASIFSGEEEIFAFDRTISRIAEMQTEDYWNSCKVS